MAFPGAGAVSGMMGRQAVGMAPPKRQIPASAPTGGRTPAFKAPGGALGPVEDPRARAKRIRFRDPRRTIQPVRGRQRIPTSRGFGGGRFGRRASQRFGIPMGRPSPDGFGGRVTTGMPSGYMQNPRQARRMARGRRFR